MDKMRIGEYEYQPPFKYWYNGLGCAADSDNKEVTTTGIILALNELAQLRAERDGLVKRVEELGLVVKAYKEKHQGCHIMEFSPCATCDFIDAVQEWVDDTKNTTPGGDE